MSINNTGCDDDTRLFDNWIRLHEIDFECRAAVGVFFGVVREKIVEKEKP